MSKERQGASKRLVNWSVRASAHQATAYFLRASDPLFLWKRAAAFDAFVQRFKGGEFLSSLKAGAAFIVANAAV